MDVQTIARIVPVLGVCYGAQLTAKIFEGLVEKSEKREYGRAILSVVKDDILLKNVAPSSQVWMSHSDTIKKLPPGFELLGTTESIPVAVFKRSQPPLPPEVGTSEDISDDINEQRSTGNEHPLYGLQFHPEVYHTTEGKTILKNFLVDICKCSQDWTPAHFITDTVAALKQQIGNRKVIMALSGGVDSTVAATYP